MARTRPGMTPLQLAFIERYLTTGNATQAYLDTYNRDTSAVAISKASACVRASQSLRQPNVQRELARRLQARQDMLLLPTSNDVMQAYGQALRFDPANLYDDQGNPLPVHLIPEHTRKALDGVDIQEKIVETKDGSEVVRLTRYRYKYPDKLRACESLARILAMGGLAPQMPTATSQTTVNVQVNSFGQDEAKRLLDMFSPKPETLSNVLESQGNQDKLTDYTLSDPVDSVSRPVDPVTAGPTVDIGDSKP
jgi:phage terminase small subunit